MQFEINKAIDAGVKYLRGIRNPDGTWTRGPIKDIGATTLAAWTLLEQGVPRDDPIVQKAAELIRKAMVTERKCYNLSLGIFFFNRLGDSRDIPFIEGLGVRLLRAQCANGSWTYFTPQAGQVIEKFLAKFLLNLGKEKPVAVALPRKQGQLRQETAQALALLANRQPQVGGDNSNTQFAMLALWVAGRYGLPVGKALTAVELHFRKTEMPNGSWTYVPVAPNSPVPLTARSQSMTPAGLLGLALGHANDKNKAPNANLLADRQVLAGFAHLARIMRGRAGEFDRRHYYFLWTLERMAVTYNLQKIDNIDWYVWGARQLLEKQHTGDGGWKDGEYAQGGCDTCFALLFLKRVNLAPDVAAIVSDSAVRNPLILKDPKIKDLVPLELLPIEGTKKEEGTKKSSVERRQSPLVTFGTSDCCLSLRERRHSNQSLNNRPEHDQIQNQPDRENATHQAHDVSPRSLVNSAEALPLLR
jgi:hypothetical protein